MKFELVRKTVSGIPFINGTNARNIYDTILLRQPKQILELGFAHGVATCYIAAALDELQDGMVTSVDLKETKYTYSPTIEELLGRTGLSSYVNVERMDTGYNWFLRNVIRSQTISDQHVCKPLYDIIVVDGAKNWTIDSSAFFLCDKLLRHEGLIIFDDYFWTYKKADKSRDVTDGITHRKMSSEELSVPHIKEIFELLVMQHPDYSEFSIHADTGWAWAKKSNGKVKNVEFRTTETLKAMLIRKVRQFI